MKTGRRIWYVFLTLAALTLYMARVIITGDRADVSLVPMFEKQMIPGALYFLAVLFLLPSLLWRTEKPRWFTALLLLVPLAADAWYLLPAETLGNIPFADRMPIWQMNMLLKCLVLLVTFFAGLRAKKFRTVKEGRHA